MMVQSTVFRVFKITLIFLSGLSLAAVLAVAVLFAALLFGYFDTPIKHRIVSDPAQEFFDHTGIRWPPGAIVVLAESSHWDGESGPALAFGPGMLDGHLMVIFDAKPDVVKSWLSENKGRRGQPWKQGPIPKDIPCLNFSHTGAGIRNSNNMYSGDVTGSDGTLLVADPETGRVWLLQWNM